MIFKCAYCGGRVRFDIDKQLMKCESCTRLADHPETAETEFVFDMYRCSSCGSQLNVNEEEVTAKCPYCGAESVVYEGKNAEFKPEYIIPFKVTQNNAVEILKNEFSKYKFTPRGIRNINIECIRPIYVPYWICNIAIGTHQVLQGAKVVMKQKQIYQYIRAIKLNYDDIDVNASKRFAQRVAVRLEPWYMSGEKKFDPMYISGMYAGIDDIDKEDIEKSAISRAREFIDKKVMESCTDTKNNEVKECRYNQSVEEKHLVLMPVWFFTASYKKKKYAAVINGQTGKVVSAVPFFKSVFIAIMAVISAVSFLPFKTAIGFLLENSFGYNGGTESTRVLSMFVVCFAAVIGFAAEGNKKYREYKKTLEAFYSSSMLRYIEKR